MEPRTLVIALSDREKRQMEEILRKQDEVRVIRPSRNQGIEAATAKLASSFSVLLKESA